MEVIRQNAEAQTAFVSGIQSLDRVVSVLGRAEIDELTSVVVVKELVQSLCPPIRQAHANLTKSLKLWEEENMKLSGRIERSIVEVSNVKNSIFQKRQIVAELNRRMDSLRCQIATNESELNEANSALHRANDGLNNAERELSDKKREQAIVGGVGAGLLVIPIVGWIAGATMVAVSLTALEDAVKAARGNVDTAANNVTDCNNRLQSKRSEQDNLGQQLSKEDRERADNEEKRRSLEAELQRLQEQQKAFLEVDEKLKNTCHVMTRIWGKSRLLNSETRYAYSLEPMIPPLQEICEMFAPEQQTKMKQTTLLSKDMDFSLMSVKLKAVCDKLPDNSLAILDECV